MEQLMHILQAALEALSDANVRQPQEIEMFQGATPDWWWIYTDVGHFVHVYPLRDLPGLWTSVHEYIAV